MYRQSAKYQIDFNYYNLKWNEGDTVWAIEAEGGLKNWKPKITDNDRWFISHEFRNIANMENWYGISMP